MDKQNYSPQLVVANKLLYRLREELKKSPKKPIAPRPPVQQGGYYAPR